jgi:phytoene dehydrogenase-like protein
VAASKRNPIEAIAEGAGGNLVAGAAPYDALVVGAGPNGLAAAVAIARAGHSVLVLEAADRPGGGAGSAALTLPGFVHDTCSAIHPFAVGSPFFRTLPLDEHGLVWVESPAPLAHPLDDGDAVVVERSVDATAEGLGEDAAAYRSLMGPLVRDWEQIAPDVLAPLRFPKHPWSMARFGLKAIRSGRYLANSSFRGERARALIAGLAAHSMLPLDRAISGGFALVLGITAHAVGWPFPRGGSQRIADALVSYLQSLGGEIRTGVAVASLAELPPARAVLLDLSPRAVDRIAGPGLPVAYRRRLTGYRYGPGTFKVDWALAGPIPWRAPGCARAATVHVGGSFGEIAEWEAAVWRGETADRPFVLLAQPSLFDPSRAPEGLHTAWAYCHVPNGSEIDMTERIEAQLERFAPGFRDLVLARATRNARETEAYNPNYVGGDINCGVQDLRQHVARPVLSRSPYRTPVRGLYICSSATPPGGGVHGMCGYYAARAALTDLDRRRQKG